LKYKTAGGMKAKRSIKGERKKCRIGSETDESGREDTRAR
jgi:hypothetical protein